MILVRDVFQIHPESMREAKAIVKEMLALEKEIGAGPQRLLTDLTGEYYTMVLEGQFTSLGDFETALGTAFADPRWRPIYDRFRPLIRGGRREVFRIEE